jgi:hypothetical protein
MNKVRLVLLAAAAVAALASGGCNPRPYRYADFESFVRPGISPAAYKRAAVLYIGYTSGSSALQNDASAGGVAADKDVQMGTEHHAADVVMYSNALVNALSRRGVTIVERNKVNDLVREQGLIQQELIDLSDVEKIRRIGKLLKVDLLVRGSVIAESGGWAFTPRGPLRPPKLYYVALTGLSVTGIDTRTGQVVWIDTMYLAQRITPRQVDRKPELTNTTAVNEIVDEMVMRFMPGGVL